jgi:hypothetical protein
MYVIHWQSEAGSFYYVESFDGDSGWVVGREQATRYSDLAVAERKADALAEHQTGPVDVVLEAESTEWAAEYCKSHGYELQEPIGYVKAMGDEHEAEIHIGRWPFNELRVSIRVDGVYIATNAMTERDLEELERLLQGAPVDYDT